MRPQAGEEESRFLERVEDKRLQYRQDPEMCLRTFLPVLSLTYRRELERLRCTNAAILGGAEELTWQMMINDAKARSNALTVTPEIAPATIAGFDPPKEVLPTVGTAALATGDLSTEQSQSKANDTNCHF
jgi:hypothetical protein